MDQVLLVALGGACGAVARWGVGVWASTWDHWSTWGINVAGCLLIGLLVAWPDRPHWVDALLVSGLCGGFTTYSAFSLWSCQLWHAGRPGLMAVYVLATVVGCLLATALGWWVGRRFYG